MLIGILRAIYLMLPAYAAIIMPVFARKIDFLDVPVDLGKKIRGKLLIGKNKTLRGYFFGVLAAAIIAWIQMMLHPFPGNICIIDYSSSSVLGLGSLLGFFALLGDTIKSFFKRRICIPEGKEWMPFDQIDFVILPAAYLYFSLKVDIRIIILSMLISPVLHYIVVRAAIAMRIRDG